jgi:hypothetical protein
VIGDSGRASSYRSIKEHLAEKRGASAGSLCGLTLAILEDRLLRPPIRAVHQGSQRRSIPVAFRGTED